MPRIGAQNSSASPLKRTRYDAQREHAAGEQAVRQLSHELGELVPGRERAFLHLDAGAVIGGEAQLRGSDRFVRVEAGEAVHLRRSLESVRVLEVHAAREQRDPQALGDRLVVVVGLQLQLAHDVDSVIEREPARLGLDERPQRRGARFNREGGGTRLGGRGLGWHD